jgi:hypothetical protein
MFLDYSGRQQTQKLLLQASGVPSSCVAKSHKQLGHFSNCPSLLLSDMLAARGTAVVDADDSHVAPPSQTLVS